MQVAALFISFRKFVLHADRSYFILLKSKVDTREQKLDNGRLTTKMAETCFVKLPTLDDNLRKQPNVTDLLTYLQIDGITGKVSRDFTCKNTYNPASADIIFIHICSDFIFDQSAHSIFERSQALVDFI